VRGPDGRVIDLDDGVGSDDEEQEDYGSDVYSDEDEAVHSDAGELDYEENSEGEVFVSEDEQADDDDNDEANGDDVPNWDELVKSVKNHDNAADGNGGGDDDDDDDDDGDAPPRKRRRRRTSTKEDGDPTDGALPVMPERVSMLHCSDPLASIVRALTHTHTRVVEKQKRLKDIIWRQNKKANKNTKRGDFEVVPLDGPRVCMQHYRTLPTDRGVVCSPCLLTTSLRMKFRRSHERRPTRARWERTSTINSERRRARRVRASEATLWCVCVCVCVRPHPINAL
jgi:hypothetical protein